MRIRRQSNHGMEYSARQVEWAQLTVEGQHEEALMEELPFQEWSDCCGN